MNIGRVYTVALTGMHTDTVTVQGFISQGLPQFTIVGLPRSEEHTSELQSQR